jgi:ABC-type uncharacterized transport system substrate-binding protein
MILLNDGNLPLCVGFRRLGIMANIGDPIGVLEMGKVQEAARSLVLEAVAAEIRLAADIAPAIDMLNGRVDALYVVTEPVVNTNRIRLNTLALDARLPIMHGHGAYAYAGG